MTHYFHPARLVALIFIAVLFPLQLLAAPFAAYVMDARTGQPIYQQNENTRLHPASLTKMMTLYMTFTAIERGQVRLDSRFTVSSNAANEEPSRLGLRAGQQIELRYLIRAAAIKSANDAATTIGEGLAGSEAAFGQQMTQMAHALGMRNTQFRNAHGLTAEGHFSTARDLSLLGRRLFYDFPQYYNLFSRRSADAGIATVRSTNKRFLDEYPGADGIKTGYTRAAGFNLTASAQRGKKRLIATVLGGTSTAQRNQVMAQLLDSSFRRIPERVRVVGVGPAPQIRQVIRRAKVEPKPAATQPRPEALVLTASAPPQRVTTRAVPAAPAQAIAAAVQTAAQAGPPLRVSVSARPPQRPGSQMIADAVAEDVAAAVAATPATANTVTGGLSTSTRPVPSPRSRNAANAGADTAKVTATDAAPAAQTTPAQEMALAASPAPKRRSETVILAAMGEGDVAEPEALEVVKRVPNSGRSYGVSLGYQNSEAIADELLIRIALQGGPTLHDAKRRVADTKRGFDARLVNLTKAEAQLACEKLQAQQQDCQIIGP